MIGLVNSNVSECTDDTRAIDEPQSKRLGIDDLFTAEFDQWNRSLNVRLTNHYTRCESDIQQLTDELDNLIESGDPQFVEFDLAGI